MIPIWPLVLLLSICSPIIADATTSSLKSKAVCSGHRVSIPFSSRPWLPLNHRHGPCSPFPSSERIHDTADVLRGDRLRAEDIRRGLSGSAAVERCDVTVPTTLGTSLDTLEYVVTVGLGTPTVNQTVLVDTGSDIPWVQCRPCPVPPCHPQKDAMFDPARSDTYMAFSCASSACLGLGRALSNGCSGSLCQYIVKYVDGSNTTGTYSSDKLTLTPAYAVDGFQFGCSHAVTELLYNNRVDGLMALGGGALSLVTQTAEKAFSYCLPPTASHSGFLTLGMPLISSSGFVVTPMHKIQNINTYYAVRLQGITVAGRRLHVPPSVFSAGSVMDSGTIITQLPPTAYRALRAAFREEMRMYPRAAPEDPFDTCFNVSGNVKGPSVALVFDRGATMELDPSGIIVDGCLAFTATSDDTSIGFIGNMQQRTFEVLYDVGGRAVGFRRGAC